MAGINFNTQEMAAYKDLTGASGAQDEVANELDRMKKKRKAMGTMGGGGAPTGSATAAALMGTAY